RRRLRGPAPGACARRRPVRHRRSRRRARRPDDRAAALARRPGVRRRRADRPRARPRPALDCGTPLIGRAHYPRVPAAATAAASATLESVAKRGPLRLSAGRASVPIGVTTALFGAHVYPWRFQLVRAGPRYAVSWRPEMVYPGLASGEQLVRRAHAPAGRGEI